jgi:predicted ATPase with chaperone activity
LYFVQLRIAPVEVEKNTGEVGDLRLEIVGLPDKGVKESEDQSSFGITKYGLRGYETKTTIKPAPGDLRKSDPCMIYQSPSGWQQQLDKLIKINWAII